MTRLALFAPLVLSACTVTATLPEGVFVDLAQDISKTAHPAAEFQAARVSQVGFTAGGGSSTQTVDLDIDYQAALTKKTHTMKVRVVVESIRPCQIKTDVLEDNGPVPAVLLDNKWSSEKAGQRICDALKSE